MVCKIRLVEKVKKKKKTEQEETFIAFLVKVINLWDVTFNSL